MSIDYSEGSPANWSQPTAARQHPAWVKWAWGLLSLYLVAVLAITMWPNLAHTDVPRWAEDVLRVFHAIGIPMSFYWLERIANFCMFLPFGILTAALLSQHRFHWHAAKWALIGTIGGFLFSACIELAQHFIPGRVSDPGDILMNGSGALFGAAVVALVVHFYRRRHGVRGLVYPLRPAEPTTR